MKGRNDIDVETVTAGGRYIIPILYKLYNNNLQYHDRRAEMILAGDCIDADRKQPVGCKPDVTYTMHGGQNSTQHRGLTLLAKSKQISTIVSECTFFFAD